MAIRQSKQSILRICLLAALLVALVDASSLRGTQKSDEAISVDEKETSEDFYQMIVDEPFEEEFEEKEPSFYEKYVEPLLTTHHVPKDDERELHITGREHRHPFVNGPTVNSLGNFDSNSVSSFNNFNSPRGNAFRGNVNTINTRPRPTGFSFSSWYDNIRSWQRPYASTNVRPVQANFYRGGYGFNGGYNYDYNNGYYGPSGNYWPTIQQRANYAAVPNRYVAAGYRQPMGSDSIWDALDNSAWDNSVGGGGSF